MEIGKNEEKQVAEPLEIPEKEGIRLEQGNPNRFPIGWCLFFGIVAVLMVVCLVVLAVI